MVKNRTKRHTGTIIIKGICMFFKRFSHSAPATFSPPPSRWDAFAMGVFLSVLGAGVLLASWLLTQQASTTSLVHHITSAARAGEVYKLAQSADWESLRKHLKSDLKKRSKASKHLNPDQIDRLVDYYVRPQQLGLLVAHYNAGPVRDMPPEAFIRQARFSGLTELTLELAPPPQFDKPWMNNLEPMKVVFALDGLSWKLKRVSAPDYMLPTTLPLVSAGTSAQPAEQDL